jgi:hypothetical protein
LAGLPVGLGEKGLKMAEIK